MVNSSNRHHSIIPCWTQNLEILKQVQDDTVQKYSYTHVRVLYCMRSEYSEFPICLLYERIGDICVHRSEQSMVPIMPIRIMIITPECEDPSCTPNSLHDRIDPVGMCLRIYFEVSYPHIDTEGKEISFRVLPHTGFIESGLLSFQKLPERKMRLCE